MSKGLLNSMVLKNLFEDVDGAELLPALIESGIITKEQIEEYYKTIIKDQDEQKTTYSTIIDGVLVKFDSRDLDKKGVYVTPNGVHTIGEKSFECCKELREIILGEDVVRIGETAFKECQSLQKVKMTDNVIVLGTHAFYNCKNLIDLKLSNNIHEIGMCAFTYCESLPVVTLPEKLEKIGNHAFWGCAKLTTVTNVPQNLNDVHENAFKQTPAWKSFTMKYNEVKDIRTQDQSNVQ